MISMNVRQGVRFVEKTGSIQRSSLDSLAFSFNKRISEVFRRHYSSHYPLLSPSSTKEWKKTIFQKMENGYSIFRNPLSLLKKEEDKFSEQAVRESDPLIENYFSKVRKPHTRTIEEKIACYDCLLRLGKEKAEEAKTQNIVLVLGNTDAGKSTFINFLYGCTMMEIENHGNQKIAVSHDSLKKEVAPIGESNDACTLLPKGIRVSWDHPTVNNPESLFLYDMPGLSDTRGFEIALANAINTKQIIANAKSVRVVFLFEDGGFAEHGQRWITTVELLSQKLGQTFRGNDIHLVITKTHQTTDLEAVRARIQQYRNCLPEGTDLSTSVSIYNPLDPADRQKHQGSILNTRRYERMDSNIIINDQQFRQAAALAGEITTDLDKFLERKDFNSVMSRLRFSYGIASLENYDLKQIHLAAENTIQAYFNEAIAAINKKRALREYITKMFEKHRLQKQKNKLNPYISPELSNQIDRDLNWTNFWKQKIKEYKV